MKKSSKIIIGLIIAVVTVGFITVAALKNAGVTTAFGGGDYSSVKTVTVQKGEISSYVTASGTIREVEKAEVYFDTPLKVKKLLVGKNQKVTKGQKLVELDMDSLNSELEKLMANKAIQELSLNSGTSASDIERARTSLESAERNYNDSKRTYERNKELYAANAISKSELDTSLKAMDEAEATVKTAGIALQTARESSGVSRKTAQENLKVTNISIEDAKKKIRNITDSMASPISGVISDTPLTEGGYTSSVQPAFTIVNPDRLQVKANVREYDIKYVKPGQKVNLSGDAISKDTAVTGKVSSISPVAGTNSTSNGQETVVEVIIDIDAGNAAGLKPGLKVDCDIFTIGKKDVLLAPMEVFSEDKNGNKLVYRVDAKTDTMVSTPVKLGVSSDVNVEITEGLKEGDVVIVDPQPSYKSGMRVKIKKDSQK